jgi:membrane protein
MADPRLARLRRLQEEAQAFLHEHSLPLPDEADQTHLRRFLVFWARVYHSFIRNRCPVRAAALAYTNLLALVPLLAVAISVSASLLKQQGAESIQDWIREGVIKAAPMLGLEQAGSRTFPLFTPDDIKDQDLERLIPAFQNGTGLLSRYLWDDRFSARSRQVLTNSSLPADDRKRAFSAELNKVVTGPAIYQTQRFGWVHLSKKISALLTEAYKIGEDPMDLTIAQITGFVANFQSGKLGVSAVLALIFLAISLLATVETTFNDIWGVTRGRSWFARIVQYWAALTLGPMFLFAAVTLTTWGKLSRRVIDELPWVHVFMPFVLPLLILMVGCALLYLVVPNTKVPWPAALLGGAVAGTLIQLNSYCNVLYVSRVVSYKQLYGSMATLPLFLLGLYFSWLLVLLGAQVAYAYQNRRTYVQERRAECVNQRGREFAAVRLLAFIGQRFQAGERPPTATEMADALRVPLRLVGHVIAALLQSGLVLEVAGTEMAYAPGRPLQQITLQDIVQALRAGQGQDLMKGADDPAQVIVMEFEAIEQAWQKAASSRTLEDLLARMA